jgi:hypothetical protein
MPAMHNYECQSCGCYFEAFYEEMKEVTETHPCPDCGDVSKMQLSAPAFKVSKKLTANERPSKLADKKFAEEFTEYHIKHTKHRMARGGDHYSQINYKPHKDTSENKPRRLSDQEVKDKIKKCQDLTIDAHKRAGLEHKLGKRIT